MAESTDWPWCVYRLYCKHDRECLLYVGMTGEKIEKKITFHRWSGREFDHWEVQRYPTHAGALAAKRAALHADRPPHNALSWLDGFLPEARRGRIGCPHEVLPVDVSMAGKYQAELRESARTGAEERATAQREAERHGATRPRISGALAHDAEWAARRLREEAK